MIFLRKGLVDIIVVPSNSEDLQDWIDDDLLLDLSPYLSMLSREDADTVALIRQLRMDNKIYQLPFAINLPQVIVVNVDMFQANDVPLPQEGWTWTEFQYIAEKIALSDDHVWGFSDSAMEILPITRLIQRNQGYSWMGDVVEIGETVQFFDAMIQKGTVRSALSKEFADDKMIRGEISNDFDLGKAAMSMEGIYSLVHASSKWKFDWEAFPMPEYSYPSKTFVTASSFIVATSSKYPKDAWEFLKYFAYDHPVKIAESGTMPLNISMESVNAWIDTHRDIPTDISRLIPKEIDIQRYSPKQYFAVYRLLNQVLSGQKSLEEAVAAFDHS